MTKVRHVSSRFHAMFSISPRLNPSKSSSILVEPSRTLDGLRHGSVSLSVRRPHILHLPCPSALLLPRSSCSPLLSLSPCSSVSPFPSAECKNQRRRSRVPIRPSFHPTSEAATDSQTAHLSVRNNRVRDRADYDAAAAIYR